MGEIQNTYKRNTENNLIAQVWYCTGPKTSHTWGNTRYKLKKYCKLFDHSSLVWHRTLHIQHIEEVQDTYKRNTYNYWVNQV